MNVLVLIPGFSANEDDWAIPVQHNLMRVLGESVKLRIVTLRYPHHRDNYSVFKAKVYPLGYTSTARGLRRFSLWYETFNTIKRLHQEQHIDVIHAMWTDETGALAVWAGKQLGIPSIVSVLGGELAKVDGYGLQHSRFSRWIVSQALEADVVLSACTYIDELIREQSEGTTIVRYVLPVDTSRFEPNPMVKDPNRFIHAASLVAVKDQATLLKAFARLPQQYELDIVGDGTERQTLEQLAKALNLHQRLRFLGAIPYLEMPKYFQGANLHLLSSKHEGLGMVTLEAAACGVPTISTAVGILPDLPELGKTVPVGDDERFASEIFKLLENDTMREDLSQAARKKVEAEFSLSLGLERLLTIYEKLLTTHKKNRQ